MTAAVNTAAMQKVFETCQRSFANHDKAIRQLTSLQTKANTS